MGTAGKADVVEIPTEKGPGRLHSYPTAGDPAATILLTHGAGGGVDAADLVACAQALTEQSIGVVLVEMPWRVAGKKLAPAPPVLDLCYRALVAGARSQGLLGGALVLGGRSAGARSACRVAADVGADGVVALAFPLHPPGKPERSRADELGAVSVPLLVVQGERDTFGTPSEFDPGLELTVVPAADHALKVPARAPMTREEAHRIMVRAIADFVLRIAAEAPAARRE